MKTWSFYDPATGLFAGLSYSGNEDTLSVNTPVGHAAIEGQHDHLSKRVNVTAGLIEDYRPSQPSTDHEWNAQAKRWRLSDEARAKIEARQQIAAIETEQPRALRELALGYDGAASRLKDIDARIIALRAIVNGTAQSSVPKSSAQ